MDSIEKELEELRERVRFYEEYERPIVVKDFKRLLELVSTARIAERDRVVAWLNRRCDYAPPCGKCKYCVIAATLTHESWFKEHEESQKAHC